ncbi:MAG: biotin carboxylase N-terminal domain-containing protein [Acidimicrobiia bacterium]
MTTTVLVANRGEIALRVFRSARKMGLRCVAVYSDADAGAPFVTFADTAVRLGPAPARDSYLRIDRIVEAARIAGADLVHPGFGFLSEDPALAAALDDAGLVFVGPSAEVLSAMGAKRRAKGIAAEIGVPVLAGYDGTDQDDEAFAAAAAEIGYPVIVKPEAGGGGKGMAVVVGPEGLAGALSSARRLAQSAFSDPRLLLERYVPSARHVEVQVIADAHGHVLHLGERDCSLQRRHQKILEESPAPALPAGLRDRLCESSVALARHVGYRSAGTCEFLVGTDGSAGFIEMNARLQVEHPVTEATTGLDLVELQLRVALGEKLPLRQQDVRPTGHAIEVRVYAEDPEEGFLPQAGLISHLRWPPRARIDSGIAEGFRVGTDYDPMLAKLIVHGPDRQGALARLREALEETSLLGVRTNLSLLRALAADPTLERGAVTTTWLESAYRGWTSAGRGGPPPEEALALAATGEAFRILSGTSGSGGDPWVSSGPWRVARPGSIRVMLQVDGEERLVCVEGRGPFRVRALAVVPGAGCHSFSVDGQAGAAARQGSTWYVWWNGEAFEFPVGPKPRLVAEPDGSAHLVAPMPGTVIAVNVAVGDRVSRGQELVVVEAMKMELAVKAPTDGTVSAVSCAPGDRVDRGQSLADLEPV